MHFYKNIADIFIKYVKEILIKENILKNSVKRYIFSENIIIIIIFCNDNKYHYHYRKISIISKMSLTHEILRDVKKSKPNEDEGR